MWVTFTCLFIVIEGLVCAGERSTEHWEVPKGIHRFTLHELAKATEGFNKVYHIGAGGFGQVYSGVLEDGTLVAIKRANKESLTGETEFRNELTLLSRLHHRHLVRLEGFCDDHNQQACYRDLPACHSTFESIGAFCLLNKTNFSFLTELCPGCVDKLQSSVLVVSFSIWFQPWWL